MSDVGPPRNDIESLLSTGYFTTTRAKSARPASPGPAPRFHDTSTSTSTSGGYKDDYRDSYYTRRASPRPHREVPRYVPRPPPPTVEDEAESLLKEYAGEDRSATSSNEDTPSRGHVDQYPILEEVPEFNPERRFVIIPGAEDASTDADKPSAKKEDSSSKDHAEVKGKPFTGTDTHRNDDYEPQSSRKQQSLAPEPGGSAPREKLERRKSRQDLPKLDTDMTEEEARTKRYHQRHRTRSSSHSVHNPPSYATPQMRQSQSNNEEMLSPHVIKHSTGGRDKAYYDYSRGPKRSSSPHRSRSRAPDDRRGEDGYSLSRPAESNSTGGAARESRENRSEPRESRETRYVEPAKSTKSYPDDRSRDNTRYRDEYERKRERRASTYRRESPPRNLREGSSSGSEYSLKAPTTTSGRSRRGSTVVLQPDKERERRGGRSRSRAPTSPLPSPQIGSKTESNGIGPSPRSSEVFSARDGREASLAYPSDDAPQRHESLKEPPERRAPRSRSRAPSDVTAYGTAAAMAMPAATAAAVASSDRGKNSERRRSPPPMYDPRRSAPEIDPRPHHESSWPPAFSPDKTSSGPDKSVGSYRRYSEDTSSQGGLPPIPKCPRRKGVVGKTDWLGLPRCDNFTICPDCYIAVFSRSSFRNEFVPMPFRSLDKAISCDFGCQPWYRIAWLLTLKNHQPDLRLFHQVASVASSQTCPGDRKTMRVWHSIRDPERQCMLPDFSVCYECTKIIEVLLPNMTGIFLPIQSAAVPSRGSCSMYFHGTRRRFVMYFDAFETTSDKALASTSSPNISSLANTIRSISTFTECHEDRPVYNENWHAMQFLPEFTVCGECFDDIVRPRLDEAALARNFLTKPQKLQVATCQLYSRRMRDVFKKACKYNDLKYLESKVFERLKVEADIHSQLAMLDKHGMQDEWTEKEVGKLIDEWKKWE